MVSLNKKWIYLLGIFSIVCMIFLLYYFFLQKENRFSYKDKIDTTYSLKVSGTIEDVGMNDMIFHRKIWLYKNMHDSVLIDLKQSERIAINYRFLEGKDSLLLLYNVDNSYFKVINLSRFEVINNDSIVTAINQTLWDVPAEGCVFCGK